MKAFKFVLVALVCLVILLLIGIRVFFHLPLPDYEGTAELEGLVSEVEVRFDPYGVPHIFAENNDDLFFAQGYITARERMFQMDMTRLAGRGELSTLFGEITVNFDKLSKTLGFYRLARSEFPQLSEECRDAISAYTRGVNAYVDTLEHLPREYVFLRARPDRWVPEDTVVCGTVMAYSLTRSKRTDLILYRIGEAGGEDVLDAFVPSYPDFAPTVSGPETRKEESLYPTLHKSDTIGRLSFPRSLAPQFSGSGRESLRPRCVAMNLLASRVHTVLGPPDIAASNWMIFSGSLTATGSPILTGSPDLKPTLPALFYVVRLKSETLDVIGGSIPGTPGVSAVGFNGKIAWSMVNGRVDELDYFIERIHPQNPDQYLTEDGYEDFQVVEETLKIKTDNGVREEAFEIKVSRHGPIISEIMPLAPDHTAMKWVGMEPTGLFQGFLELNRASTFDEFRNALRHVKTPTLNVGYADVKGNIGYQYVASPPIRRKGTGALPVPGWTGAYEWEGAIPFEELPFDLNPKKGYLASFNNPAKKTHYHLTNYYLFERALRFEELAKDLRELSLDEARGLQLDTVSVVAKRWVPHVLGACQNRDDLSKALRLFDGWDGSINTESPAATLFNAFYFRMMENTFADEVGVPLWLDHLSQSYIIYIPDLLLTRIIDRDGHILFDNVTTTHQKETRSTIIVKSMEEAVAELTQRLGDNPQDWAWGKVHRMAFTHPLDKKLPFLNLRPIPTHGDTFTINAGMWNNQDPYEMESGGVIRLVVDFSDIENSTIICPPGQSGHYMSPHYSDLARMWAEGKQAPMHLLSAKELPRILTLKGKSRSN
jgi:penicillin amidase